MVLFRLGFSILRRFRHFSFPPDINARNPADKIVVLLLVVCVSVWSEFEYKHQTLKWEGANVYKVPDQAQNGRIHCLNVRRKKESERKTTERGDKYFRVYMQWIPYCPYIFALKGQFWLAPLSPFPSYTKDHFQVKQMAVFGELFMVVQGQSFFHNGTSVSFNDFLWSSPPACLPFFCGTWGGGAANKMEGKRKRMRAEAGYSTNSNFCWRTTFRNSCAVRKSSCISTLRKNGEYCRSSLEDKTGGAPGSLATLLAGLGDKTGLLSKRTKNEMSYKNRSAIILISWFPEIGWKGGGGWQFLEIWPKREIRKKF